jgi:hypothetical protein
MEKIMKQKQMLWGIPILILISFACNFPGASGSPTPTTDKITEIASTAYAQMTQSAVTQLTLQPLAMVSPTIMPLPPTVTLAPFPTSAPIATAIPALCNQAQFVSETIPDDSPIPAGKSFVKSWRLMNIGTCTWTPAYQLVFVSGEAMGAAAATAMNSNVPPGGTVDVSISLTAPVTTSSYQGFFKLRAPSGVIFGLGGDASGAFWVKINSVGAITATATGSPTTTGAPLPDLQISTITFNPVSPTHNTAVHVTITVYNAGNVPTSGAFMVAWWAQEPYAIPNCTWAVNDALAVHAAKVVECDYTYANAASNLMSKAQADTGNNIAESNEGNNELKVALTVQ